MNDEITRITNEHKRQKWRQFADTTSALLQLTNDIATGFNHLKDNSLLISAPKSTVTLFSPDPHQAKTHPRILIEDSQLPLVQCPNILGVYLDTSLSFNKHSGYVAERVSNRNNILKALAGTSWGQQKETLLMTYKAVGRSIINYAAPVRSTNLRDTNYRSIQYTQNEALRIATGCHKMSSVDHLHAEAKMLKVREHSELLSAQYLARCLEPGNVCHSITTRETPKRRMKETLFTRHRNTVEPMMLADNRKEILHAIHTDAVNKAVKDQKNNIVLDDLPHPINDSERDLTRKERATLAQLRSGYCKLLGSYKSRIKKDASLDVKHLFACPAHPTTLIPSDLWSKPVESIREFSYLEEENLD